MSTLQYASKLNTKVPILIVCCSYSRQYFNNMCSLNQALKTGISFSSLFPQKSFSGVIKRPFAYLPKFSTVLIAEKEQNKVGIYNARTLSFLSWMTNPDVTKGTRFQLPSSFLVLENRNIILIEEFQMHIFNEDFIPIQEPITGQFLTLTEESDGILLAHQLQASQTEKISTVKALKFEGGTYCYRKD